MLCGRGCWCCRAYVPCLGVSFCLLFCPPRWDILPPLAHPFGVETSQDFGYARVVAVGHGQRIAVCLCVISLKNPFRWRCQTPTTMGWVGLEGDAITEGLLWPNWKCDLTKSQNVFSWIKCKIWSVSSISSMKRSKLAPSWIPSNLHTEDSSEQKKKPVRSVQFSFRSSYRSVQRLDITVPKGRGRKKALTSITLVSRILFFLLRPTTPLRRERITRCVRPLYAAGWY